MHPAMLQAALLLLLSTVTTVTGDAVEGQPYYLPCLHGIVKYWLLHGVGDLLLPGHAYDDGRVLVDADGNLHIKVVTPQDEGQHLCVVQSPGGGTIKGLRVPMKVRRKPSTHPWEDMYRQRFTRGIVAAIVCALIAALGCLVHRHRYRAPQPVLLKSEEEGHYNPALEVDAESTGNSTTTDGNSTRM